MKKKRRFAEEIPREHSTALIAVSVAFLLGGIVGFAIARQAIGGETDALLRFIQSYWDAARLENVAQPAVGTLVWKAVRFPLLTFILGFTALGIAGIPILFFVRGFLFSFSVACFVSLFGAVGGLLSFLLLGLSGMAAVPPLFVLGTQGMVASRTLLRRYFGARRDGPVYTRTYFLRCGVCAVVLAVCILFDYFAVPVLIRAMASIL